MATLTLALVRWGGWLGEGGWVRGEDDELRSGRRGHIAETGVRKEDGNRSQT